MTTLQQMIDTQLQGRNITDSDVLEAMQAIDRKLFVPDDMKEHAYADTALPIGGGQTISQPYIVAFMAQTLDIDPDHTILEIGTGCGYNAAVLSKLAKQVYSVEIIDWLGEQAKENLEEIGIGNVTVKVGDGYQGWPEYAPYDRIILTAAPEEIPESLKEQLAIGGRLLAPVGKDRQILQLVEKVGEGEFKVKESIPVRFVEMTTKDDDQ